MRICADCLSFSLSFQQGDNSTNGKSGLASLAIVGIGVDMIFVPRLRSLIARQARRISASSSSTLSNAQGAQFQAAQQLARRIMHDKELETWSLSSGQISDRQIQQLAKV